MLLQTIQACHVCVDSICSGARQYEPIAPDLAAYPKKMPVSGNWKWAHPGHKQRSPIVDARLMILVFARG